MDQGGREGERPASAGCWLGTARRHKAPGVYIPTTDRTDHGLELGPAAASLSTPLFVLSLGGTRTSSLREDRFESAPGKCVSSGMRLEPPLRFFVIGNPENRRIAFFQAALRDAGMPPARVLSYRDLLACRDILPIELSLGMAIRIESPGEDFEVDKSLLLAGVEGAAAEGCPTIEPKEISRLELDRGLILYPRQWYLGYRTLLERLAEAFAATPGVVVLNQPNDIAVMFDKEVCHTRCSQSGVPVPVGLGSVGSYDELVSRMNDRGMQRVFVKLSNGSSASGVVAFSRIGGRQMAITSAEVVHLGERMRLYNSLKVRCYREPKTIARLIDALCREHVHVEEWLPKASLGDGCFDLRIVTIDGEPQHTVVRQGRSPMTNLHLGNRRGDTTVLWERLGPDRWRAIQETCRQTAAVFPGTLHTGLDICVTPGWRRHAVVEVNAFGDLLPGVLWDGSDTYGAEVAAVLKRYGSCRAPEKTV
jgi:glutathione synthase/RimK-type ligase-like ATP-grasp enzyme